VTFKKQTQKHSNWRSCPWMYENLKNHFQNLWTENQTSKNRNTKAQMCVRVTWIVSGHTSR